MTLFDVAHQMADALHASECRCRGRFHLCRRCSALQQWTWWLRDQRDPESALALAREPRA